MKVVVPSPCLRFRASRSFGDPVMTDHVSKFPLPITTTVDQSGLRYVSKRPGSPFVDACGVGPSTRSCFFCGKHNGPSTRSMQKVMGRSEPVCAPLCPTNPRYRSAYAESEGST